MMGEKQRSKKRKRFLLRIIMFIAILIFGSINYSSTTFASIDMTNSFDVKANPDSTDVYKVTADGVSLGNGAGPKFDAHYQIAQATTKFTVNWNRSFTMEGKMISPNGPDCMILAFHNTANKGLGGKAQAGGYLDGNIGYGLTPEKGLGTSVPKSLFWYFETLATGHVPVGGADNKVETKNIAWGKVDGAGNTSWTNNAAQSFDPGKEQNFKITWDATDKKFTLKVGTSEYTDTIIPSDAFAHPEATYFTMGTSLYQYYESYGAIKATMSLTDFSYTDMDAKGETTITGNPANPGETITVSHTIYNNKDGVNYDIDVPMRISEFKLGDKTITPIAGSIKVDGTAVADGIANGANSNKTVNIKLPKDKGKTTITYTYKVPTTGLTTNYGTVAADNTLPVVATILLGTEGMTQTPISGTGKVNVKFDDVFIGNTTAANNTTGIAAADTNSGNTPSAPVATFEKAKELVKDGGTIWVCGDIGVANTQSWTLNDKNAIIKRWNGTGVTFNGDNDTDANKKVYDGNLVSINAGGNLTLTNITLDGAAIWSGTVDGTLKRGTTNSGVSLNKEEAMICKIEGEGATLTMETGAVLQNNAIYAEEDIYSDKSAGVYVKRGTFIMNGGKICNMQIEYSSENRGGDGPAIAIWGGNATINGGEIYGNYSDRLGGAIRLTTNNSLTINGGDIHNNKNDSVKKSSAKGIIFSGGNLTITGGTIRDNETAGTSDGGGVYVDGGTLNMSGGEIKNNIVGTEGNGGGVYVSSRATINVSAGAIITDNHKGSATGALNNLYLVSGKKVNVTAALSNTANIGVTAVGAMNLGDQFGIAAATGYANMSKFYQDTDSKIRGMYGTDKAVIWGLPSCQIIRGTEFVEAFYGDTALEDAIKAAANTGDKIEMLVENYPISKTQTVNKSITITTAPETNTVENAFNYRGTTDTYSTLKRATGYNGSILEYTTGTSILENITIDGGSKDNINAAKSLVYISGATTTISLNNSVVLQNNNNTGTDGDGGAVTITAGVLNITNATDIIQNCRAESGGAISLKEIGQCNMANGEIKDNVSFGTGTNGGGAINVSCTGANNAFTMTGGTISGNKSTNTDTDSGGGAIQIKSGNVKLTDGTISNNYSASNGGGVFNKEGLLTVGGGINVTGNFGGTTFGENQAVTTDGNRCNVENKSEATEASKIIVESNLTGSIGYTTYSEDNHVAGFKFAKGDNNIAKSSYDKFFDDYDVLDTINDNEYIKFTGREVDFNFTKVALLNMNKTLSGAEFKVYELVCTNNAHNHKDDVISVEDIITDQSITDGCWKALQKDGADATYTSGNDGVVNVAALKNGTYMLVETKAPIVGSEQYALPQCQWRIVVDTTEAVQKDKIELKTILPEGSSTIDFSISGTDAEPIYKLPNMLLFELPRSGGKGIFGYTLVGVLFMSISTTLFILIKRRNKYINN